MRKPVFIFILAFVFAFLFCFYQSGSFAKTAEKPQAAYPYSLKRNPFQTFLYTQKHVMSYKAGELPLLQYGISSLKVVGIMERRGKYFAMLQTPDNRSYIITVGSLVGVNRARVVSINSGAVNLVERTYNILGQLQSMNVVMPLK